ncbi:Flp family type IVb pilin [Candidatus Blastococcus massiliensis]|uniref:Flp family type IVb pilin n=1 Tax=Candidatus Blastococcus massiliensis TaxID=1470358 RepID=UPI0004AEBF43|nr:Flp family type IVb pilin [Candidatus Blastococcus massiliensis]
MINPFIALQLLGYLAQDRLEAIKNDEKGATAVEYALIVAAVAAVIAGAMTIFGGKITALFNGISLGGGGGTGTGAS